MAEISLTNQKIACRERVKIKDLSYLKRYKVWWIKLLSYFQGIRRGVTRKNDEKLHKHTE